jgi:1,4-dihydroxy-6-naphthoate synthase
MQIGFSPCPNDCFIFDALIHHKIDTEGLDFEVFMEDVETLNQWAMAGKLAVTKLSYHAFAHLIEKYALLDAGSALGFGCGPLLIARKKMSRKAISSGCVGIPGKWTTANFLLSLAFPEILDKKEMVFSEIEEAVLSKKLDAGLIIHENRFTFEQKGLVKLLDLGEYWEKTTQMPIPLGGIVVRRDVDFEVAQKINRVLRRSVEFAFAHPESSMPFVRRHAQAMSDEVMKAHIALYVNEFSIDLGEKGRAAVTKMFEIAAERDILVKNKLNIFSN